MTLWVLVVTGWLAGTVLLWRLPELARRGPTSTPPRTGLTVSVVVPARDEAGSLPALLASVAAQGRTVQLLVVDDGSTDATASVAAAGGARVVTAPPLPAGWLGKPWALQTGVTEATGDVLVLLDADVTLAPGALDRLLAVHAAEAPDGLLSVQPHHVVEQPYEHLSLLANVVPLMASGMARPGRTSAAAGPDPVASSGPARPARGSSAADPVAPSGPARPTRGSSAADPVAFGPCLVTTRTALAAVGGLDVVAGEITEDLALARAYRSARRPVRCCTGGELVRFRMYPDGLRSLVQGWTKNLAAGAMATPVVPTLGAVLWVTALLASVGLVLTSTWWVGVLTWAAMAGQVHWMARRVGTFRWWAAALYPVAAVAFVVLFVGAAVQRLSGRPVTWRGRRIRTGEVVD